MVDIFLRNHQRVWRNIEGRVLRDFIVRHVADVVIGLKLDEDGAASNGVKRI